MGADGPLVLENPRIAVKIDLQSGALRSIRDKELDVVSPQAGIGFDVVTTEGILHSEKASAVNAKAAKVELRFAGRGLDVNPALSDWRRDSFHREVAGDQVRQEQALLSQVSGPGGDEDRSLFGDTLS